MEDAGPAGTATAAGTAGALASAPGGPGTGAEDTPLFVYGTLMNDKVSDFLFVRVQVRAKRSGPSYGATLTTYMYAAAGMRPFRVPAQRLFRCFVA